MSGMTIEAQTLAIRNAWVRQFVNETWAAQVFDEWLAAVKAEAVVKPPVSGQDRSVANDPGPTTHYADGMPDGDDHTAERQNMFKNCPVCYGPARDGVCLSCTCERCRPTGRRN